MRLSMISCLALAAALLAKPATAGLEPSIVAVPGQHVLFGAKANRCPGQFIPDAPARAFRRADGNVEVIATHWEGWFMTGPSVTAARAECRPAMPESAYAPVVPGQLWIEGTYTDDGRRVEALVSQDLTSQSVGEGCNAALRAGHCWVSQIVAAHSNDMGATFRPGAVVASLGDRYPESELVQFGFFTSSNIVKREGYYYAMLYLTPGTLAQDTTSGQAAGSCLFRTKSLENPSGWRGLSETGFDYDPTAHRGRCTPVETTDVGPVRSLSYLPSRDLWIAVTAGRHRMLGDASLVPGFYAQSSPDLIHWSSPSRIMQAPLGARRDSFSDVDSYPSLIDPDSASTNFETLDHDTAILLFTDHHLSKYGTGTLDRDLDYVTVRIQ